MAQRIWQLVRWGVALALALGALGTLGAAPAQALPQVVVDTVEDDGSLSACTSAPGDCSLRGAVNYATKHSGMDEIYVPAGTYYLYGGHDDENAGGDLDIKDYGGSLTIVGEDPDTTIIDGYKDFSHEMSGDRIFHVVDFGSEITLTLRNLTLRNGYPGKLQYGGAIKTYGSLVLQNMVLVHNTAHLGGAIYMYSPYASKLVIENSDIADNLAYMDGGGLYAWGQETVITKSVIQNNRAMRRGGGIYNASQTTINTSTIYNNMAMDEGGGLMNFSFLGDQSFAECNRCTFYGNNPNAVENFSNAFYGPPTTARVVLRNSIVAQSKDMDCEYKYDSSGRPRQVCRTYDTTNCKNTLKKGGAGGIENGGNNIDTGTSCGFSGKSSLNRTDPQLELQPDDKSDRMEAITGLHENGVADNGGPTGTLGLKAGSPAIDRGNMATCDYRDQRGLANVGKCDIGAFEYDAKPVLVANSGLPNTEKVGDLLGSPLRLGVYNTYGNALENWRVVYTPDAGSGVQLSTPRARTNQSGQAMVVAALDGAKTTAYVTAQAGPGTVRFKLSGVGVAGQRYKGPAVILPATGFAPGAETLLGEQPLEKVYSQQNDMQLVVPKLGVKMAVVGVPQVGDSWDLSWLWEQAGYLEGTAFPTWAGNSVITGHVYLPDGKPGPFVDLKTLGWGDRVEVQAWGQRYVYEVREVGLVKPGDLSPLRHEEQSWLTLITCQDYDAQSGQYASRLVVRATLISIETQ